MTARRNAAAATAALMMAAVLALGVPASAETLVSPGHDVGTFDPETARWFLQDAAGGTASFSFGDPGDLPLVGDWDGDGIDTPAVYDPDTGWLEVRNWIEDEPGPLVFRPPAGWLEVTGADAELSLPQLHRLPAGGIPVAADPDGDGRDAVSIAVDGRLHVFAELPPPAGTEPDEGVPVPRRTVDLAAGDFDGDGRDEFAAQDVTGALRGIGDASALVSLEVGFGAPLAGDWDGNGIDTPGTFEPLTASLTMFHGMRGAPPTTVSAFGATGLVPLTGSFGALHGADPAPERALGIPPLAEGDTGRAVEVLQEELTKRGFYRGPIDGEFGDATRYAVVAFHKALGVERTYDWEAEDSLRLAEFALPPLPARPDEPDRVEVDIGRQLLFVVENHEVTAVAPVSTGGSYLYYSPRNDAVVGAGTPRGDFTLFHLARGWHCDPLTGWCIYNPWSFTPYYAVHGYLSVPEYPASHGCVRLTTWDSDELTDDYLYVGLPIHIWDTYDPESGTTLLG